MPDQAGMTDLIWRTVRNPFTNLEVAQRVLADARAAGMTGESVDVLAKLVGELQAKGMRLQARKDRVRELIRLGVKPGDTVGFKSGSLNRQADMQVTVVRIDEGSDSIRIKYLSSPKSQANIDPFWIVLPEEDSLAATE